MLEHVRNNRYRKNYCNIIEGIKKEWKFYLFLCTVGFLGSAFLMSLLYQLINKVVNSGIGFHLINPFFIIYYGIIKMFPAFLACGLAFSFMLCYWRLYTTMLDYEYDPRGFAISPNGTYGTNRIMSEDEQGSFIKAVNISDTTANIVGKNEDGTVNVVYDMKGIGPHKFVSGASGSWKTSSVFLPDMMQTFARGESMICTDPKGELRSKTLRLAKKHNYTVREFNLIRPILSDGCDFMKMVETYGDARTFTEIIMSNTSGDSMHNEDFWAKGERAAICFGVLYVKEAAEYEGKGTFHDVFVLLTNDLGNIKSKAERLPDGSAAKNQWNIFRTTPENSQGGIMTGVATRLQFLNDPAIAEITGRDEIDPALPGKCPCVYYVLMSDQESTNNVIASIFFSFLFIKLTRLADERLDQKLQVPVNFLLDEMPNIGKIPDFPKKLSTIRSREMRCTICTQDVGQLQAMYPGTLWANVISNCDTQVMLGCNDPEITGPFWSKSYGTMTIVVNTEKTTEDRFRPFRRNDSYAMSSGEGKREVFTVGEICGLENKYALVKFRSHNVMQTLKFSYFDHPMYSEIEEESYIEHVPEWWDDIIQQMETAAKSGKNYQWFEDEMESLAKLDESMKRERAQQKQREEALAGQHRHERILNGTEEGELSSVDRVTLIIRTVKHRWKEFTFWLKGNAWDGEVQDANTGSEVDTGLEYVDEAYRETGIADDAVIETQEPDFEEPDCSEPVFDEPVFDEPGFGDGPESPGSEPEPEMPEAAGTDWMEPPGINSKEGKLQQIAEAKKAQQREKDKVRTRCKSNPEDI